MAAMLGVFQASMKHFHDAGDISGILIDSTIVRAHASAAGAPQKKGGQEAQALVGPFFWDPRSRRIYDETVSLSAMPVSRCVLLLIAGHRNDNTQAPALY